MIKVNRSFPAPKSLEIESKKVNGKYNLSDVTERLNKDFHGKCYICEIKPTDPEVEHLMPHKGGLHRDRMFDWNNLFNSCPHCNKMKKNRKYDGGIVDCCKVDPENYISHTMIGDKAVITARQPGDDLVDNTVDLINEAFNKVNTGIRIIACDVRTKQLIDEMKAFYDKLKEYQEKRDNLAIRNTIKGMLSRSSAFSAFKREYIREHKDEYPELYEGL